MAARHQAQSRHSPRTQAGIAGAGDVNLNAGPSGCGSQQGKQAGSAKPEAVRAQVLRLLPASARDRPGWAADIATALSSQSIPASTENICSVLAVIGQESNFNADPTVPDLANIARREIDRRAKARHIPAFVAHAALLLPSSDGRRYSERLDIRYAARKISAICLMILSTGCRWDSNCSDT